jgi:hypothetical protein
MYRAMERPAKADEPPILEWWNVNQAKIPLVANLARRYLCIPATSAPSERVFWLQNFKLFLKILFELKKLTLLGLMLDA